MLTPSCLLLVFATALEDRDFVRRLTGQAVSVHVDNDLVASVPLKLTPWPE